MPPSAHDNDPRFVEYYASESGTERARSRAVGIMNTVLRVRSGERGDAGELQNTA